MVVRVWREREGQPIRARLTWFGEDGLPQSAPVVGSPREVADAVQGLLERELGLRR
jgi:hypothetical protein